MAPTKLIFATRGMHFPPVTGGQLRTQGLLNGLAESFAVTIVSFEHHPDSDDGHTSGAEIARAFPHAHVVTVPGLGGHKRLQQASGVLRPGSWTHGRYVSAPFREAVFREARDIRAAIVHFADVGTALNGPVPGMINAVAPDNIEHRIVADIASRSSGLKRLFAEVDVRKLSREEPSLWRRMDICVAVSEIEAHAMTAAGARHVVLARNGTGEVGRLPLRRPGPEEPLRLLFVGTGTFQPNEHGLAWFIDEVVPRLRERLSFLLDVVGQPPERPRHAPEVVYHGRVERLSPFYEGAHIAVVPVRFGGGSRLKTVEAMAFGVPLVSTKLGGEGLPVSAGDHYLGADDAETFAATIGDLAERLRVGDLSVERMVSAARTAAEGLFWPRIAADLAAAYTEFTESAPRPPADGAAPPLAGADRA